MSASDWKEATAADGRTYYWNTATKETRWTKPEEAPAPAQDAGAQPWREYTTAEGKKYYHNVETKATVWEMPEAFRQAQVQTPTAAQEQAPYVDRYLGQDAEAHAGRQQNFVAGGSNQYPPQYSQHRDRDDRDRGDDRRDRGDDRRDYGRHDRSERSNFVPATTNEPEYRSLDEAESAFMNLMKRSNVQLDWTWEDAMRATIKDPQYRALKDPKERRTAFEKYILEQRAQNKEREKERQEKLKHDFTSMLKSHPEIKHNTRWKTARPIIEGETIFRSAGDDTERRQLFEDYVQGLRKQHADTQVTNRKAALEELSDVLQSLDLEPYSRWSEAQGMVNENEKFRNDDKFKSLTKTDILAAFENHIKSLERTFNDARQSEKNRKGRRERQHRDKFIDLLRELQSQGKIRAGTKWMQVLPLFEDDERYHAMLGQPGSTPLDLFWDIVEEEERALRGKRNDVLDVLDDKRYEITISTTVEEYMTAMHDDKRTSGMLEHDLKLIFERLHEKVVKRSEEDKHHAERAQRKAVDALRSRIKHLDPPVRASDTWDDVRPRLERYEEYRSLDTGDLRKSAFDKFIRRLEEKEADREAERSRRADRDHSRTNGHKRGRDGHSRTPEIDVYEAERRKAMAARERQYRKASTTGLSPPPAESPRRRDRYEDRERHERGRLGPSGYDRDRRRPPDYDRERGYMSRADPRDGVAKELDYGDSRAGSMSGSVGRRRRGSDANDGDSPREAKRAKHDRASRTPAAETVGAKEEEALKSGSEEGEIEEV